MDIRIAHRDILIPVRGLKKTIPTGRKYRITEEKKEEMILAAFRDHFSIKRRCQHADEPDDPKPTSKLTALLAQLPYTAEERKYIADMFPIEIEKVLCGLHMENVDFGGGITRAFWGEQLYSLRYTRNCVVFRFTRVYRDYQPITANRYIDECVRKASLRLKVPQIVIHEHTAHLTGSQMLVPDAADMITALVRERLNIT